MNDDDDSVPEHPPALLLEERELEDGTRVLDMHGSSCERTQEVHQALREGREPPPPGTNGECKGPAKVNSPAFRRGWDAINWGSGSKKTVGQA